MQPIILFYFFLSLIFFPFSFSLFLCGNTNPLYHILYFILCSTNRNMSCVYFFSILNFNYFIRKIKQIHDKKWLVEHKVERK